MEYIVKELQKKEANNDIDYEFDFDEDSIQIRGATGQFLIINKPQLNEIWYSSPISGASRFKVATTIDSEFPYNYINNIKKFGHDFYDLLFRELNISVVKDIVKK